MEVGLDHREATLVSRVNNSFGRDVWQIEATLVSRVVNFAFVGAAWAMPQLVFLERVDHIIGIVLPAIDPVVAVTTQALDSFPRTARRADTADGRTVAD